MTSNETEIKPVKKRYKHMCETQFEKIAVGELIKQIKNLQVIYDVLGETKPSNLSAICERLQQNVHLTNQSENKGSDDDVSENNQSENKGSDDDVSENNQSENKGSDDNVPEEVKEEKETTSPKKKILLPFGVGANKDEDFMREIIKPGDLKKEKTKDVQLVAVDKKDAQSPHYTQGDLRDAIDEFKVNLQSYIDEIKQKPDGFENFVADLKHRPTSLLFADTQKTKSHKRIVFYDMKIERVYRINTEQQTFHVKFHYYLTWLLTKKEYQKWVANKKNWEPDWEPKIDFVNGIQRETHQQKGTFKVKFGDEFKRHIKMPSEWKSPINDNKLSWDIDETALGLNAKYGCWVRVRYDAETVFWKELNLKSFPFDCQDLEMILKLADCTSDDADLLPFPRVGDFITFDVECMTEPEWKLCGFYADFGWTKRKYSKTLKPYPIAYFRMKVQRDSLSYLVSFCVTFVMFVLGLGTFALDITADRLQYCVVFLLADLNTFHLLSEKLPTTEYMTILGFYMFSGFIYLSAITGWSCLAVNYFTNSTDGMMSYVFAIIFCLVHLFLFVYICVRVVLENQKLTSTKERLYKYTCFCCCKKELRGEQFSTKWGKGFLAKNESQESENDQQILRYTSWKP